jgi:hypothetical protein
LIYFSLLGEISYNAPSKHESTSMPIPKRPIRVDGNIAYVLLPHGLEAIIDAEDAEKVGKHNWYFGKNGYAATNIRNKNGKKIMPYLHRFIMNEPDGMDVDHIHGNTLDNRKSQLRVCTTAENCRNQRIASHNTSGLKGVSWHKQCKKWRSYITIHKKHIHLGLFDSPERAHQAYCEAAKRLHGEFFRAA